MSELSKEETPTQSSGKGGTKFLIIGIVGVVAILVGTIVVLAFKMNSMQAKEEPKEKKSVITAENAKEVIEEWVAEDDKYVPKYFTVVQNTEWTFPDGTSPSTDAKVANDVDNETPVYFDVVIEDTGEKIYSSPVLELGAQLDSFQLDKDLDAGVYACTVIYHLVDEEQNELTTVNVGVTITINN